jgi:hypothetical protein
MAVITLLCGSEAWLIKEQDLKAIQAPEINF